MSADFDKLREVFLIAAERYTPEQWPAYLDQACAGDDELRRNADMLLKAHAEGGGSLDCGTTRDKATQSYPPLSEVPGTVIGSYKLLEQIGEGGFGIVFMAEQQQPLRRKVALKVLKPGMDTRQVIARFEAERQALALMDHPNIAKVLDGGETATGRPYFVMDLVKGIPITEYCNQNHLSVRDRLDLFVQVCQAVQHAHQKGIIHRDLKPTNVLVTMQDGAPLVKVIDFGIAKAIGQQLTDKTLFTGFAQLIGSPLYMSPEQAALCNVDVDTRSDIYSLGVLLYELLTGTTPFDKERFKEAGYDEMRRIIREEEPPKPSTRISTLGQAATTASTLGKSDSKHFSQLLRGELDWIVMKCLEKDRNRRYESASTLRADVERYLRDEPVQACPPSALYRFRKFARRNKAALLTVVLVSAGLVLVMVGLAVSNARIREEKDQKEKALGEARRNYEAAEANLLLARQAVDEMYTQVAGKWGGMTYMQPFQRDILQKALRFYQEFARRNSRDPAIRLETASAGFRIAAIQYALRERRQAKEACDDAIAALEELSAELPTQPDRRSFLAAAYSLRGTLLMDGGRFQQSEKDFRRALVLYGDLAAEQPDIPDHWSNLAAIHQSLGGVLFDRLPEAEKAFRESVRLGEELLAKWPNKAEYRSQLISRHLRLARFLAWVTRSEEAARAFRRATDLMDTSANPQIQSNFLLQTDAQIQMGEGLPGTARREELEKAYRRLIAATERLVDRFPDVPGYRRNLAEYSATLAALLHQAGKRDDSAVLQRSVRDQFEKLAVELRDDEESHDLLQLGANCLTQAGDLAAAEQLQRKAVILAGKLANGSTEPDDRVRVASDHERLGAILQRCGRARQAADQFRQGLAIYAKLVADFPDESSYRLSQASCLNFMGIALRDDAGQRETALRCHQLAIPLCEQLVAEFPDWPRYRAQLVRSHFGLGIVLRLSKRFAEAEQAFQQAIDAYHPPPSGMSDWYGSAKQFASVHNEWAWLLATCVDANYRDASRAVQLARKAVELWPADGGFTNTLGVAYYRAENWKAAIEALEKAEKLAPGKQLAWNAFFLAMAHWNHGEQEEARKEYQQAVLWMEKKHPKNEELLRFRTEAEELLKISEKKN